MRKISALLCLLLLLISTNPNIEKIKNPTELEQKITNLSKYSISSINDALIDINGNEDFHIQANTRNWLGDGSQSNPYIITYDITGLENSWIEISNTDLHFIIANFFVTTSSGFEIYLWNVKNSKIVNNTLGIGAIVLDYSIDSIVENNNAEIILVRHSSNNIIKHNTNRYVGLNHSSNNLIIENHGDVDLIESPNNIVSSISTIIYLDRSPNTSLINNSARFFLSGDKISQLRQGNVVNNTLDDKPILFWQDKAGEKIPENIEFGAIYLINCTSINCTNQNIEQSSQIFFCSDLLFQNNSNLNFADFNFTNNSQIINNNLKEFYMENCNNISITNNTHLVGHWLQINNCERFNITYNTMKSIHIYNCVRFNISDNNFPRGGDMDNLNQSFISFNDGFLYVGSNNNTILNNSGGLYLNGNNNFIMDNSQGGITLSGHSNRIINNSLQGSGLTFYSFNEMNLEDFLQEEVSGNTLDGESIIFFQNVFSGTIPPDVNQIILVNCWNIEISDQDSLDDSLQLIYSGNITIQGNTLLHGNLQLYESNNNIIHGNNVMNGKLELIRSHNNNVTQNYSEGNYGPWEGFYMPTAGISLYKCDKNILVNNSVVRGGFSITGTDNKLTENSAKDGLNGFVIYGDNNLLTANIAEDNEGEGFFLDGASGNELVGNIARNNTVGIFLRSSFNNLIYFNKFFTNQIQANDEEGFNNLFKGNYFSDHTSPDFNNDYLVDIPYIISGTPENSYDFYPVSTEDIFQLHIVIPPRVTFPNGGEIIESTTTISWFPTLDSQFHSISYSVYYSSIGIDNTEDWVLIENNILTNNYIWNIESLPSSSSYLIKIIAKCSNGSSVYDISDDTFSIINPNQSSKSYNTAVFLGFITISGLIVSISTLRVIQRKQFK